MAEKDTEKDTEDTSNIYTKIVREAPKTTSTTTQKEYGDSYCIEVPEVEGRWALEFLSTGKETDVSEHFGSIIGQLDDNCIRILRTVNSKQLRSAEDNIFEEGLNLGNLTNWMRVRFQLNQLYFEEMCRRAEYQGESFWVDQYLDYAEASARAGFSKDALNQLVEINNHYPRQLNKLKDYVLGLILSSEASARRNEVFIRENNFPEEIGKSMLAEDNRELGLLNGISAFVENISLM